MYHPSNHRLEYSLLTPLQTWVSRPICGFSVGGGFFLFFLIKIFENDLKRRISCLSVATAGAGPHPSLVPNSDRTVAGVLWYDCKGVRILKFRTFGACRCRVSNFNYAARGETCAWRTQSPTSTKERTLGK